jgi:GT2 family glycosyltransferase
VWKDSAVAPEPAETAETASTDGIRDADTRVSVVVITHNRREELLRTLGRLAELPERPPVFVVDNASADGTAETVARVHPWVRLLRAERNLGAVGRNVAVERVTTPYVAFCDDDSWWEPGSLAGAADLLDAHPRLAAVTARIVVEPGGAEDPIVAELRDSPVPGPEWLPGPALGSFLAAATVLRAGAFREAGGFSPRLWLGGEEELLATDLMVRGWWLAYAEGLTVHHAPSAVRDATARREDGLRNTLWFGWLRRPLPAALRRTWRLARTVPRDAASARAFGRALAGLPWVLRERRVVPGEVEERLRLLEEEQRRSAARRYVG